MEKSLCGGVLCADIENGRVYVMYKLEVVLFLDFAPLSNSIALFYMIMWVE